MLYPKIKDLGPIIIIFIYYYITFISILQSN